MLRRRHRIGDRHALHEALVALDGFVDIVDALGGVTITVTERLYDPAYPNEDGLLKPGMFMTVDLQRDRGDVLMAPEQAIVPEGSRQYVYVVSDGGEVLRVGYAIGQGIAWDRTFGGGRELWGIIKSKREVLVTAVPPVSP